MIDESLCNVQSVFVQPTGDIEMEIQLLIAAIVRHFAAKGRILILAGRVEGEVAHSHVVPIWSQFTFNLVRILNHFAVSGPGERDRRRVETIRVAFELARFF